MIQKTKLYPLYILLAELIFKFTEAERGKIYRTLAEEYLGDGFQITHADINSINITYTMGEDRLKIKIIPLLGTKPIHCTLDEDYEDIISSSIYDIFTTWHADELESTLMETMLRWTDIEKMIGK